jgi:hypothetical protein
MGALCVRREIVKRAGAVALLVGSLLALINHPDLLFGLAPVTPERLAQVALTYLVPYAVSTHGQVSAAFAHRSTLSPPDPTTGAAASPRTTRPSLRRVSGK